MSAKSPDRRPRDLVYGEVAESLVFIPHKLAVDLATVWDALGSSSTWGEFRRRVPSERYSQLLKLMASADEESGDEIPADDAPFPGFAIPGVADGDYPEWPAQVMLRWVPSHIREAPYAQVCFSAISGQALNLDPRRGAEIIAAFRAAGFQTTKDEALVLRASGRL